MGVLINQRYHYQIILPYSEEALKALTVLQREEDVRGEGGVVVRGADSRVNEITSHLDRRDDQNSSPYLLRPLP
ncbi:uncharacterized protein Bfra_003384 [Botrytis fragariae]|uniref:Uncharacterized protein n=1 Tax=Botrytis fragariae TaxID=1964551 RepID=A0A8H6AWC7_9HELO|nr:uncharacterized protein Bfra_003384 [Botrytis fragariae]KAF5874931.1 hypothetical protein Bfra_003384 [Botrytis fragariae]